MYEDMFAERLARLRTAKGVSARDMSLSIGQNPNYINHIELKRSNPSMDGFFYICEYLGVTPGEFFEVDNNNPKKVDKIAKELMKLDDELLESIFKITKALNRSK